MESETRGDDDGGACDGDGGVWVYGGGVGGITAGDTDRRIGTQ